MRQPFGCHLICLYILFIHLLFPNASESKKTIVKNSPPRRYHSQVAREIDKITICNGDACDFCGLPAGDWRWRTKQEIRKPRQNGVKVAQEDHMYPWIVSFQYLDAADNWIHYCSGTLVSERIIVTAAHCNPDYHWKFLTDNQPRKLFATIRVVAGTNDWHGFDANDDLKIGAQIIERLDHTNFNPHHEFVSGNKLMDIAVVFLPATKFNFSSTVQKICMINPSLYMPTIASYSQAWIAGFGALTDAQGLMMFTKDGRMRDAQLLIFHEDICHELKTFKEFDSYTNICAGEADAVDRLKDSKYHVCIADTGGPLMIKVSLDSHGASTETIERMALLGVVSKPHGCQADRLLPGVYVNVPLQFDWLRMWFDRPRRQPGAFEYGKTVLTDARGFEHPVTVAKYRWYPYPMDIPFAREEDGGIDGVCPCTFESIRPFKSTLPPCLFPGEGCSNNAGADICCKGMCKLPNLIKTALQPGAMPQWPYYQIIKGNYGVCPF